MCLADNIHLLPSLVLLGWGCYPSAILYHPSETTSPACSWAPGCPHSRELRCAGQTGRRATSQVPLCNGALHPQQCLAGQDPLPTPQPIQLQTASTTCWTTSHPHRHLPGSRCHDTAALLRGGLHAAARAVVAHAKIVADFVGHSGSCSDGLLRVVLHRDGACISTAARRDGEG